MRKRVMECHGDCHLIKILKRTEDAARGTQGTDDGSQSSVGSRARTVACYMCQGQAHSFCILCLNDVCKDHEVHAQEIGNDKLHVVCKECVDSAG